MLEQLKFWTVIIPLYFRNKDVFYSKLDEYRGRVTGAKDCKFVYSVLATR